MYLGSQQVALFNVNDTIYAINNRCSHARGPLCEGQVFNQNGTPFVTCPWHKADFDLRTGEVFDEPIRTPVQSYAIRMGDDGMIYIAEKAFADAELAAQPVLQGSAD